MSVLDEAVAGSYEMVGVGATYHDAAGQAIPVRVVEVQHADDALPGLDLPMRGPSIGYRVRKSELSNRPRKGDSVTIEGVCRGVITGRSINRLEWFAYVSD